MVVAVKKSIAIDKSESVVVNYNFVFFVREFFRFSRFLLQMLWAFPVAIVIRWKLRKNKKLNEILKFDALLSVRGTIEKGSFAYDSLLFNVSLFDLFKNKTHLANLVCLAIIIGDEYIDGLAQVVGKEKIIGLLKEDTNRFYLKIKQVNESFQLHYCFKPELLFDEKVLGTKNAKYGISYEELYLHLLFLLKEINNQIAKQSIANQHTVAQLISEACNNCFDTYIEDMLESVDDYSFESLEKYQKRKDDAVVNKLLQLRACLLNKSLQTYQTKFDSWSALLRSMQLYDDMQDIGNDYKFQKNVLAYYAKNFYPTEWQWVEENEKTLQTMSGAELYATISTHMAGSVMCVMQQARNLANTEFDWVQLKIQNYLWRKNWLCIDQGCNIDEPMHSFIQRIDKLYVRNKFDSVPTCEIEAHKLQLLLMYKPYYKAAMKILSRRERYVLKSYYVELPTAVKQELYKKITKCL